MMFNLDSIIARKLNEINSLEAPFDVSQSEKSFVTSLRSQKPSLIAEVKPQSPSKGVIIDRSSVPEIVSVYNNYAQAISVLCDEADFGGGYDLLSDVRTITELPILAKEFIIDPKQIRAARHAGADAVLLIASILFWEDIDILAEEAMALNMGILFEIHQESEIAKIPSLPSDKMVIGINNRNLNDLSIDLNVTEMLAPRVRVLFPDHLIVSESGVGSREDIIRLSSVCDGFLIGTTFLKSDDVDQNISDFFSSS